MRLKSIIRATLALAAAGACSAAAAQEPPERANTARRCRRPRHPRPRYRAPHPAAEAPAAEAPALASAVARPEASRIEGEFVVGDIRIEGLQRISEGTVYNYLPINIGDRLDQRRVAEALRALYDTKFFRDVELRRDGGTLVVAVLERPSIESFEIKGNKDIKTEDLQKSLRNVGLATGKTFDQSVLDEVKQYLTDQYFSRGKYAVRIDAKVEEVPGNKVKLTIDVNEGQRAKIRQINIAGNTAFPGRRAARAVRAEDAELAVLVQVRTTATRASRCRATWRSCARTTWIAATRISASPRRRSRSRRRRTTSSSRSTCTKATSTRSPT